LDLKFLFNFREMLL